MKKNKNSASEGFMSFVQKIGKGYSYLIRACKYLQSPLLLVIRLFWGWQFFISGLGKLENIPKIAAFFESLGISWPYFNAYFVGIVECFGGLLLLFGLATRLIAIPLIIVMIVALISADPEATKNLFHDPKTFMAESPFLFLYSSLIILAFGPGKFSLDYWLRGKKNHIAHND